MLHASRPRPCPALRGRHEAFGHAEVGVIVGGRIWEELRKGATPEAVAREQEGILSGMDAAFTALDRLQTAALSFEVGPSPPAAVVCISGFPHYKDPIFAGISVEIVALVRRQPGSCEHDESL